MPTYAHLQKSTQVKPGLSDLLIAIKSEMVTINKPTAPFTNPGDSLTITTAHEFDTDKGFYRVYQIKQRHDGKGDMAGNMGSKTFRNEFKVFVPGLDAVTLEFVNQLINEECISLHRDGDCDNPLWWQLGDECVGVEFDANYTTGTVVPEGEKGFILTAKWTGVPKVYAATIEYAAEA